MERNYDEVISDMLIQLVKIESQIENNQTFMDKMNKRMDLTIKRMVKAESHLDATHKRMEAFDKKLEQSIKNQQEFSEVQSRMNKYFLSIIEKNSGKKL
jgi:predicted  nucleic acid-binding Zn-ribbon protein